MKHLRKPAVSTKTKFSDVAKDEASGNRKGCGLYCTKMEEYLLCPSCETFIWHKSCAEKVCDDLSIDIPNWNSAKWKCPNF